MEIMHKFIKLKAKSHQIRTIKSTEMNKLLIIILLATYSNAFSQDWPVKKLVMDKKSKGIAFADIPAFSFSRDILLPGSGIYQELNLNPAFTQQIVEQRPDAIKLSIPLSATETIICELVRVELGNIKFTENNDQSVQNVKIPVMYRGIISGEQNKNNVMLTVTEDYMSLNATLKDNAMQLTKGKEQDPSLYKLYNRKKIQFPVVPFDCGTKDKPFSVSPAAISLNKSPNRPDTATGSRCVNIYVDCFDSLYIWQASNYQQTINFVYELFNAVATGYTNEQINIQISNINVWTSPDPFRADNRENALADLSAYHQDAFWGNICVGLDYGTNGGGRSGLAGAIGKVKSMSPNTCAAYSVGSHEFCYTDLKYSVTVQNFPITPNTTGPQIYLVEHEIGHLLGAHHTKWCGWKLTSNPDTYGTLDSCGTIEGGCAQGPPPPVTGATIMSYCVSGNNTNQFVNFNNGFGTLPGNAVRAFVNQAVCIPDCLACLAWINPGIKNTYAFLGNNKPFPKIKK